MVDRRDVGFPPLHEQTTYLCEGFGLTQFTGKDSDVLRHPGRKCGRANDVTSRRRVLLPELGEAFAGKPIGKADQSGPQSAMNECDFAVGHAANKNIVAIAYDARQGKDLAALWMGPPIALDRRAGYRFSKRNDLAARRFQNHAVLANEGDGLPAVDDLAWRRSRGSHRLKPITRRRTPVNAFNR
jgi:hypothetical protein